MMIIVELLNKLLIFVFCMSIINIIKHIIMFYIKVIAPEDPAEYILPEISKILLMASIASFITIIIIQFKIF